MSQITDASNLVLANSRVFLDTNIWILINGYSSSVSQWRVDQYSSAYKRLLGNENAVILNDVVIGEFFNRCAKIEYETAMNELREIGVNDLPSFKKYRRSSDFSETLKTIRDTCLNMIDDCEFISTCKDHYNISNVLNGCLDEKIDFSDLMLISFCRAENLAIMTDDIDYANCGLSLITANKKLLATS